MGDLSKNFSRSEFSCKCGCGFNSISLDLVAKLQDIRDIVGPMTITSGCRCVKHNQSVGGENNSPHLRGLAADIYCPDSRTRYNLLAMIASRFRRYGVYKSQPIIHVDVDESLDQDVVWVR